MSANTKILKGNRSFTTQGKNSILNIEDESKETGKIFGGRITPHRIVWPPPQKRQDEEKP